MTAGGVAWLAAVAARLRILDCRRQHLLRQSQRGPDRAGRAAAACWGWVM